LVPPEYGSINEPLRDPATRPAVWEALRDDVINTISSDSLWRQTRPLEDVDEYGLRSTRKGAWGESFFNGSNGFVLPVMLSEGVHRGMLSLPRLVQACAETPARAFGLYPRKGTIAPGADADLVLVDLDLVRTVDRRMVTSRGAWSVWEGATLRGWPTMVLLRGTVAMEWPAQASAPAFKEGRRGTYVAPVR
jgi:dihydroorotase-like cyclic amidohydrolase